MAILDYRLQETINPMDVAMKGFQGLQSIQANREAILARQAQAGAFMAQQQAEQVRAAQINQEMQQAQAMMAKQQELADHVAMGTDTREHYQAIAVMMSKSAPEILDAYKNASEQKQQISKGVTNKFAQAFAMLRAGQTEAARGILQSVRTAVERDPELAPQANVLRAIEQVEDPNLVLQILGQYLQFMSPDQLESAMKASVSVATEKEQIETAKANAQKAIAEAERAGIDVKQARQDLAKGAIELASAKSNAEMARQGIIQLTPEQLVNTESSLRKEWYAAYGSKFAAAQESYSKMAVNAALKSGAGDVALITEFRKVLDPTSVVRETEFAQVQGVGGVLNRADALLQSLKGKGLLNDAQRAQVIKSAQEVMGAVAKYDELQRARYRPTIRDFGLSEERVLGTQMPTVLPRSNDTTPTGRGREVP